MQHRDPLRFENRTRGVFLDRHSGPEHEFGVAGGECEFGEVERLIGFQGDWWNRINFKVVSGDRHRAERVSIGVGYQVGDPGLINAINVALFDASVEHDAGNDENEHGQDFQKPAKNRPHAGVVFALRAQHALNDCLIRAPIPDAKHRVAEENCIPRHSAGVAVRAEHAHHLRVCASGSKTCCGFQRGHHADPPASFHPGERGQNESSHEKNDGLDGFRDRHGRKTARHGVDTSKEAHQKNTLPFSNAENVVKDQPSGRQRKRDVENNRRQDRNDRQPITALAAIPALQKIRQRRDFRFQIKRGEEKPEQDERESSHPLEIPIQQTRVVSRLSQADQMDAGNVCREECEADHRPTERVRGHEVIACNRLAVLRALPPRIPTGPAAEANNGNEVDCDNGPVDRCHGRVCLVGRIFEVIID